MLNKRIKQIITAYLLQKAFQYLNRKISRRWK